MQNVTLYTHHHDFDAFAQLVRRTFPKASVDDDLRDALNASVTVVRKGGWFSKTRTLTFNHRRRQTPGFDLSAPDSPLAQNLLGMQGFVHNIPAESAELKQKFMHLIGAANAEVACLAEPDYDAEFERGVQALAKELNAFFFAGPDLPFAKSQSQHFLDADFALILDTAGRSGIDDLDVRIDASTFDAPVSDASPQQLDRKQRSEAQLAEAGVKVNANLPVVAGEEDTEPREAEEILDRAYALLLIAARGENIERERLEAIRTKLEVKLSPAEQTAYDDPDLDPQTAGAFVWRYESLHVLLWSLGIVEALPYPDSMCDVGALLTPLLQTPRADVAQTATRRTKTEILDALDLHYRYNWACVDARVKQLPEVAGGLHPGVVYERHYALNWLTRYRDQEWDKVSTDT